MKKYFLFIFLIINSFLSFSQKTNLTWNESERKFLISGLIKTQSSLQNEIENLNKKQLFFKPSKDKWSVAEVIEHIGIYEELLYWDLLNNQYTEVRPDLAENVASLDSAMLAYATDPNNGQAPFAAKPLGRFNNKKELSDFFNLFRNEVIKLVETAKTDFRLHFIFRPKDWGIWHKRDLHQYTLLWIAHTERHINQIKRIKELPNFPK